MLPYHADRGGRLCMEEVPAAFARGVANTLDQLNVG